MRCTALMIVLIAVGAAHAQSSASYTVDSHVFNQGGTPLNGFSPDSTSWVLSQISIGDAIPLRRLSAASYAMETGFGAALSLPGEVNALRFSDDETLLWDAGSDGFGFNLYRGAPFEPDCLQSGIDALSTTDGDVPAPGAGWAYLVVAVSRLGEEGTRGFDSTGIERRGVACE